MSHADRKLARKLKSNGVVFTLVWDMFHHNVMFPLPSILGKRLINRGFFMLLYITDAYYYAYLEHKIQFILHKICMLINRLNI